MQSYEMPVEMDPARTTAMRRPIYGHPHFDRPYDRPFYGGYPYYGGGPFLGGVLGGLVGSTLVSPYLYGPPFGYGYGYYW